MQSVVVRLLAKITVEVRKIVVIKKPDFVFAMIIVDKLGTQVKAITRLHIQQPIKQPIGLFRLNYLVNYELLASIPAPLEARTNIAQANCHQ